MSWVFISYAREDQEAAARLYRDLTEAGYPAWLDKQNILPGQRWKDEIAQSIRESSAFILLISETSVGKRGFVQREIRQALDVLAEMPANQIFVIPVRLDAISPDIEELNELNWVDLFDGYERGVALIRKALDTITEIDQSIRQQSARLGPPADDFDASVRRVLEELPEHSGLLDEDAAYWIRFETGADGVVLPADVRRKYPQDILVVLQHQFKDLEVGPRDVAVTMWFSGAEARVVVPYPAITHLEGPGIMLEREASPP